MKAFKTTDWESHLVNRAQMGEQVAFELLMDLHRDALLSLAMRMLRNRDDALDAVQEVAIKSLRALPNFRAGQPVLPWMARICTNCCVDIIRRRRKGQESIDDREYNLAAAGCVHEETEDRLENAQLRAAISRLPRVYRRIVEMRHFEELEVSEIALKLNRPEGTIKSWLFRARQLLRRDLVREATPTSVAVTAV